MWLGIIIKTGSLIGLAGLSGTACVLETDLGDSNWERHHFRSASPCLVRVGTHVTIKWDAPGQTLTLGLRSGPSCLRRGEDCERQGERISVLAQDSRWFDEPEDDLLKFRTLWKVFEKHIVTTLNFSWKSAACPSKGRPFQKAPSRSAPGLSWFLGVVCCTLQKMPIQ